MRRVVPFWVYAPHGRDAQLLRSALRVGADAVRAAPSPEILRKALSEPDEVGVLVLTQEVLTGGFISMLADHLERQPPWSELPIILLVDPDGNTIERLSELQALLSRCKLLVLERPLRVAELESAAEAMRLSKLRQFALRDYIQRQDLLRRELNHRVKNILATVQALYGLTARNAPDLDTFASLYEGRLAAMAGVHEVLYANDYGDARLNQALDAILSPYREAGRLTMEGDAVMTVSAETAQSIALVAHELLTNAVKYGALSVQEGRVTLVWHAEDDVLRLVWTERGGPPVTPPETRGYGVSFMELTAKGLGGSCAFDFATEGLTATLEIPGGADR